LFAQVTLGVDPAAKEEEKKEKTFSQVIERYLTVRSGAYDGQRLTCVRASSWFPPRGLRMPGRYN
jgi:hypothetical protein